MIGKPKIKRGRPARATISRYEAERFYGGIQPSFDFTPSQFSGLKAWYEARNTGFVYNDNDLVTTVNDLSGNGLHLTAPLGLEPTYKENGGDPYIQVVGAKRLQRDNIPIASLIGVDQGTIFVVSKDLDQVGRSCPLFYGNDVGGERLNFHNAWSDQKIYIDWGDLVGGGRVSFNAPAGYWTNFKIDEYVRAGSSINYYYNGVLTFTGSFTDTLSVLTNTLFVGSTEFFTCNDAIVAILIYNRPLIASERDGVRQYLQSFLP